MATLSETIRSSGASVKPFLRKASRPRLLGTTAVAGVIAALSTSSVRADDNWTGAVSSDWFTAANWSNGIPTTQDVIIQSGSPHAPVIGAPGAATTNLNQTGSLIIQNGGTLKTVYNTAIGYPSGNGTLTVDGFVSKLTTGIVGLDVGFFGNGTVNFVNGGAISTIFATLG
jgi:T5SS/PEP-CTERM-associated repeat protein